MDNIKKQGSERNAYTTGSDRSKKKIFWGIEDRMMSVWLQYLMGGSKDSTIRSCLNNSMTYYNECCRAQNILPTASGLDLDLTWLETNVPTPELCRKILIVTGVSKQKLDNIHPQKSVSTVLANFAPAEELAW